MAAGQVAFVAPLAASRVPAGLFAALPAGAGTEVDYTARRDAGKPAAARGAYRVAEDDGGMAIRGPRRAIRWCTCAVAVALVAGIAFVIADVGLGGRHDWRAGPAVVVGATAVVLMAVYFNAWRAAGLVISRAILASGARTLART